MTNQLLKLKWTRPETLNSSYPKVWKTFKARDLDSDSLVEYCIQDLPESRVEDAINHLLNNYLKDEPLTQVLGGSNDPVHVADCVFVWRSVLAQNMALVCFRAGSDEIVGLNLNCVMSKCDNFDGRTYKIFKSKITTDFYDLMALINKDFDTFGQYGVDEYLTSYSLSVDRKYRGRGIGEHFFSCRKDICKEIGMNVTHTCFSNSYSGRIAEKVGFKTDVVLSYDEISKSHPEYPLKNIQSLNISSKTLVF